MCSLFLPGSPFLSTSGLYLAALAASFWVMCVSLIPYVFSLTSDPEWTSHDDDHATAADKFPASTSVPLMIRVLWRNVTRNAGKECRPRVREGGRQQQRLRGGTGGAGGGGCVDFSSLYHRVVQGTKHLQMLTLGSCCWPLTKDASFNSVCD